MAAPNEDKIVMMIKLLPFSLGLMEKVSYNSSLAI